jgi:hypothetical protein
MLLDTKEFRPNALLALVGGLIKVPDSIYRPNLIWEHVRGAAAFVDEASFGI